MTTNDTYTIEKQIVLRAPRSRVWRALTDVAEFEKWFHMIMEGPFEVGAVVKGHHSNPDFAHLPFEMTIDRVEPEHTFAWRWHPGMPRPGDDFSIEPMTKVVFTLEEVAEGTLLHVEETGFVEIPEPRRSLALGDNMGGWEGQLQSIKRYVEDGGAH